MKGIGLALSVTLALLGSEHCRASMSAGDFFNPGPQRSLAEAAERGRTEELQRLVTGGADVNAQGADGMTALYWATGHLSKKGVSWLLDHGANPNVEFKRDGTSATSVAATLPPWFLHEILAHGGDLNYRNPMNERTPIFDALLANQDENVRTLIAAGADMNTYDHVGLTPMVTAAVEWKYQLVYAMLNAGANPTVRVPKGRSDRTLLWFASRNFVPQGDPQYAWKLKVIALLKEKGFDVLPEQ